MLFCSYSVIIAQTYSWMKHRNSNSYAIFHIWLVIQLVSNLHISYRSFIYASHEWKIEATWNDFSFCVNLSENFAQFSITFKCLPFIIFSAWLPLCYQNLTQPSQRLMLCCSATTKTMYFWLTARIAGNQN